ncbi:hypothetical protein HK405_013837 [Cladochytrium tenue]|nr:hypothetical protein HK405_013837 [Cladochytrium tenue]
MLRLGTWGALAGSRRLAIQSPQQRTVAGIKDIGLPAGAAAGGGFVPGWYGAAFWRVVGTYPQLYAAGGVVGSDYLYSTRFLDQGVAGTRVVAAVVGYGSMYCRGVGADADPVVACVQFDDDCSVAAEYALYQSLGRWSNYSAKAASLFSL